jgi:hypothetical protein
MENDNKEPKPLPQPTPIRSVTLIDPRDHFIGIALGKIVENQVAAGKWEHDVAASHAVRFADAVMRQRATISRQTVSSSGRPFVPQPLPEIELPPGGPIAFGDGELPAQPPPPKPTAPVTAAVPIPGTVPAPIAERIGVQPPVVEVG